MYVFLPNLLIAKKVYGEVFDVMLDFYDLDMPSVTWFLLAI